MFPQGEAKKNHADYTGILLPVGFGCDESPGLMAQTMSSDPALRKKAFEYLLESFNDGTRIAAAAACGLIQHLRTGLIRGAIDGGDSQRVVALLIKCCRLPQARALLGGSDLTVNLMSFLSDSSRTSGVRCIVAALLAELTVIGGGIGQVIVETGTLGTINTILRTEDDNIPLMTSLLHLLRTFVQHFNTGSEPPYIASGIPSTLVGMLKSPKAPTSLIVEVMALSCQMEGVRTLYADMEDIIPATTSIPRDYSFWTLVAALSVNVKLKIAFFDAGVVQPEMLDCTDTWTVSAAVGALLSIAEYPPAKAYINSPRIVNRLQELSASPAQDPLLTRLSQSLLFNLSYSP